MACLWEILNCWLVFAYTTDFNKGSFISSQIISYLFSIGNFWDTCCSPFLMKDVDLFLRFLFYKTNFLLGLTWEAGALYLFTKELQNCILCIIRVWSLFCSVRVFVSLHFLAILLAKLGFRLSMFWFFVFLYLWLLVFSFSVLCFKFNVIWKDLTTFV